MLDDDFPDEDDEDEDEDCDASEQIQARLEEIGAVEFGTLTIHHHHHRPEGTWVDRVLGRRDDLEGF